MKKILFILTITFAGANLYSQIQVYPNNNVGIGTSSSVGSKLSIYDIGSSSYGVTIGTPTSGGYTGVLYIKSNVQISYGIVCQPMFPDGSGNQLKSTYSVAYKSNSSTSGRAYGFYGIAGNATAGYNAGVLGIIQGSNAGAGVYGQTDAAGYVAPDAKYAGYFSGNVKVIGTLWVNSTSYTSDARLKRDISQIDSIDKFFSLNPVKYYFKSKKEQDSILNPKIQSDTATTVNNNVQDSEDMKKLHFGLLAQEVQAIYPNLVYQSGNGSLGIDYIGLIPIIIEQLKIMKLSMDLKDQKIIELEDRIKTLEMLSKER